MAQNKNCLKQSVVDYALSPWQFKILRAQKANKKGKRIITREEKGVEGKMPNQRYQMGKDISWLGYPTTILQALDPTLLT